jgi:hypothetical protein
MNHNLIIVFFQHTNYWADYQFEELNYVDLVFCCVVRVFPPTVAGEA